MRHESSRVNRRELLLSLSAAPLIGCAANERRTDVTPLFGKFTAPPTDGRVVIEVHFHDEPQVREICRRLSSWPEGSSGAPACVSDTFTPGVDHLHIARPRDWDDWPILIQLGHEVLHALKARHR